MLASDQERKLWTWNSLDPLSRNLFCFTFNHFFYFFFLLFSSSLTFFYIFSSRSFMKKRPSYISRINQPAQEDRQTSSHPHQGTTASTQKRKQSIWVRLTPPAPPLSSWDLAESLVITLLQSAWPGPQAMPNLSSKLGLKFKDHKNK